MLRRNRGYTQLILGAPFSSLQGQQAAPGWSKSLPREVSQTLGITLGKRANSCADPTWQNETRHRLLACRQERIRREQRPAGHRRVGQRRSAAPLSALLAVSVPTLPPASTIDGGMGGSGTRPSMQGRGRVLLSLIGVARQRDLEMALSVNAPPAWLCCRRCSPRALHFKHTHSLRDVMNCRPE
jgi:hypothetical protein